MKCPASVVSAAMSWEVETQPAGLFHTARDWGDLLVTRQLVEPLFYEQPGRCLASNLIDRVRRVGRLEWRLSVADGFRWSSGGQILARDLCRQLRLVNDTGGPVATCTALFARARANNALTLTVTTRIPVGDIRAWLTSPALGPASPGITSSSGKYALSARHDNWLELVRVTDASTVRAVTCREGWAVAPCAGGREADASSLMGGVLFGASEGAPSGGHVLTRGDLDIIVGIDLPAGLEPADVDVLDRSLDRQRVADAAPELLRTRSSATEVWTGTSWRVLGAGRGSGGLRETEWVLTYTRFPPNELVANRVVAQLRSTLGMSIRAVKIPYGELVEHRRQRSRRELRLVLAAPVAAHPVAPLTDTYLRTSRSPRPFTREQWTFLRNFVRAVEAESMDRAVGIAADAENSIMERRMLYLASLRAAFRHIGPTVWIPPSGLFDISAVHRNWHASGDTT